jgi:sulfonate transport system substrate-binding protein
LSQSISRGAAILATVFTALSLANCSRPSASAPVVLHVGDQRGSIRSLLKAAGELDHTPYTIEWDVFPVGAPLIEAMKAGAVDFGYVGSSTMTFGLASGAGLKAINVWRFEGPGSGLLVRAGSGIKTLADLRGHKIAVVRGSPGHLLAVEALRAANIPQNAVTFVYLTAADAKAAMTSGSVDAWAIWDPYLAIGEHQDGDRVITTSAQLGPEVETGVSTPQAIEHKRAQLLDFIARVQRAYAWAETHKEAMSQAYAADTGVPIDIARIVQGRMHIHVLSKVTDDAIATHQKAADIYTDIGLIPRRIDVAQVYDRSFNLP